jgi:hypothetical protein
MRFIEQLCPPALLYLIFLVIQLGLDLSLGLWITFAIKLFVGFAVVVLLDTFCGIGLSPVSWFLVAAPFVMTALATAISMSTGFDEIILVQTSTEKFTGGDDNAHDIYDPPESSASVPLVAKTDPHRSS